MPVEEFFERATQAFEVLGVSSMVVGFMFAFALSIVTWKRTGSGGRAFKTLRESLGGAILLGLELLVAAEAAANRRGECQQNRDRAMAACAPAPGAPAPAPGL